MLNKERIKVVQTFKFDPKRLMNNGWFRVLHRKFDEDNQPRNSFSNSKGSKPEKSVGVSVKIIYLSNHFTC